MPIKITHDGEPAWHGRENCAFCNRPTNYWFMGKVAVCEACAATHDEADVPTKAEWLAECRRRAQMRVF